MEYDLIKFFEWLNNLEDLRYTKKGIRFYVAKYLEEKHRDIPTEDPGY